MKSWQIPTLMYRAFSRVYSAAYLTMEIDSERRHFIKHIYFLTNTIKQFDLSFAADQIFCFIMSCSSAKILFTAGAMLM